MIKNTILLFSLILLSGCAERGYTLTNNAITNTVITESVSSIQQTKKKENTLFKKMKRTVKKALKKQNSTKKIKKRKIQKQTKKTTLHKKIQIIDTNTNIETKANVENNTNTLLETAKKSRELRKAKLAEALKMQQNAKIKAEKNRITTEIEKNKKLEALKKDEDEEAVKALELQIQKEKEERRLQAIEREKANQEEERRLSTARKNAQQKLLADKQAQKSIKTISSNNTNRAIKTTERLKFHPINKVYHKFGTSEIHGHVIYLNDVAQETRLNQTRVYLLPVSAKLNHWYTNYYLKNKKKNNNTIVSYLNKTTLNLEKNFEFFGVPAGSYYVIIESNSPSTMSNSKKVYIAKKIKVGKYKKIMGVFSKKL